MLRIQPRLAFIVLATLGLSACGDHEDRGPVRTERRDAGAFDAIEMVGAARLDITIGEPVAVEVEGRERTIDRIQTEVRDNTLYIESKSTTWVMSRGRPRVTIRISLPRLASLQLEGGNDVHMSGFAGGASKFNVAGATRLKAEGQLEELTVHMTGAGHADLSQLLADQATVTVDGVGSVVVHPKDTLDATMNGIGAILYTGTPRQVNTRMNGLGTIGQQRADDEDDDEDAAADRHRRHDEEERRPERPTPNPDDLKPEREEPRTEPASESTEVI